MTKSTWRHREWHIRNELFRYKTDFQITYLALYILSSYEVLRAFGVNLATVIVCIALFWLELIFIVLLSVDLNKFLQWRAGCSDKCEHPNVYLRDAS